MSVVPEVVLTLEPLAADIALVGSLACVGPLMIQQVVGLRELPPAVPTGIPLDFRVY